MFRAEERKKKIEKREEFIQNFINNNKDLFCAKNLSRSISETDDFNSRDEEDFQSVEKREKVLYFSMNKFLIFREMKRL